MTPLPPGLPVVAPYQTRPPTTSRPATPLPMFEPDATAIAGSATRVELASPTHIDPSPSGAVAARTSHAASAPVALPHVASAPVALPHVASAPVAISHAGSAPVAIPHVASAPVAAPHAVIARGAERSEPLRVISMKQPGSDKPRVEAPRLPLHVQLRSIAEVAGRNAPQELGNLAPPRDAGLPAARARTPLALWVCIGLAIAFAIAFAIWFIAGR